jgi:hypothetical protein
MAGVAIGERVPKVNENDDGHDVKGDEKPPSNVVFPAPCRVMLARTAPVFDARRGRRTDGWLVHSIETH